MSRLPPPRSFQDSVNHLAVCAAGWVGQRTVDAGAIYWAWALARDGQSCDATELDMIGRPICLSADEVRILGDWATARAEAIVAANRAALRAVADELLHHDRLSARRIRSILLRGGARLPDPCASPASTSGSP